MNTHHSPHSPDTAFPSGSTDIDRPLTPAEEREFRKDMLKFAAVLLAVGGLMVGGAEAANELGVTKWVDTTFGSQPAHIDHPHLQNSQNLPEHY